MTSPRADVPPARRTAGPDGPDGPARARSRATAWRWLAALAVAVSAVVHLVLWRDGYADIAVVGPLFLLQGVAGLVLAVLLVVWRHWLPALGAVGYGAATLGAFGLSATVGFAGVHSAFTGPYEVTAAVAEAVAIVAGAVVLLRERAR